MKVKTVLYVTCIAIALLLGVSCNPQELPGGTVTVVLSSGLPETRGAAEIEDGSEIYVDNSGAEPVPDLVLLLFNSSGTLVARYPDGEHSEFMSSPTPSGNDMKVRLLKSLDGGDIPSGPYSIYALANTSGLWELTDGTNTIGAGSLSASSITSQEQADLLYFSPLFVAESNPKPHPELQNSRLPLTATASLSVTANGNGTAELQMKRCVAQVVVRFVNNYTEELVLNNLSVTLKDLNTSTGFLFRHDPDTPTGILNADLAHSAASATLPDNTDPNNDTYDLSALVFPGEASGEEYTCDISFDVAQVGTSGLDPVRSFSFSNLPVHNKRGEGISSLGRNQQLTITVTISQGQMLSFSFDVGEWTEKTETTTFD